MGAKTRTQPTIPIMRHDQSHNQNTESEDKDEFESAIEEALGEEPRAAELRRMRDALLERRRLLLLDLKTVEDGAAREKLKRELTKLQEHIKVLSEEADITNFVEDAVRVGIEMRKLEN
ncbi:MAG: hypothetical protein JWN98_2040 [Abditibacteriota bacterium]|nr:hypothetical protein [Abditibacteriota bacterium]